MPSNVIVSRFSVYTILVYYAIANNHTPELCRVIIAHLCVDTGSWIDDVLTVECHELLLRGTEWSGSGAGSIGSIAQQDIL